MMDCPVGDDTRWKMQADMAATIEVNWHLRQSILGRKERLLMKWKEVFASQQNGKSTPPGNCEAVLRQLSH